MATDTPPTSVTDESTALAQMTQYAWDADHEYQTGLAAILGSASDLAQAKDLTLRARWFFFQRKFNVQVDFDSYMDHWTQSNNRFSARETALFPEAVDLKNPQEDAITTPPAADLSASPSGGPQAPYSTSFQEIVELIQLGKPIPGIKEIPPTVLEGQGTSAAKPKRRKPWEKDDAASLGSAGTLLNS